MLVASALAHASPAGACTMPPPVPAFIEGSPLDGATGVPTDVLPFYQIPLGAFDEQTTAITDVPGRFTLVSASGDEVALAVRLVHGMFFELTPSEPLAPNTEHVLRGEWTIDTTTHVDELRFTTGSGPVVDRPRSPDAHLVHFKTTEPSVDSCELAAPQGTCVWNAHGDQFMELAVVSDRGEVAGSLLVRGAYAIALLGSGQQSALSCVRLRTRAANGELSAPVTVCGDQQPVRELATARVECTVQGPAWLGEDGERIYLMAEDDARATAEEPIGADAAAPDEVPTTLDPIEADPAAPNDAPAEAVPSDAPAEPIEEAASTPDDDDDDEVTAQPTSASDGCTALPRAAHGGRAPITWLALVLSFAGLVHRRRSK